MTKTKYEVYFYKRVVLFYVTTTRNCEDMINEILRINPLTKKIFRIDNGVKKSVHGAYRISKNESALSL